MIFSMIKKVSITVLLLCCLCASAQDVRYYKLARTRISGVDNRDVSGGQFVAFVGNVCFESNKNGVGVNHGTLTRNNNYSNNQYIVYQGSSYWGTSTTFKFNSDKSVLNVVLDNGDVYVYKRATPPAGVTTCSLIRKTKKGNRDDRNPGFTPSTPYQPNPYTPTPTPTPDPQTPPEPRYVQKTYPCNMCHGNKTVWDCDPSIPDFDGNLKYCSECGKNVPKCHVHVPCKSCGGKGYYTKMERQ